MRAANTAALLLALLCSPLFSRDSSRATASSFSDHGSSRRSSTTTADFHVPGTTQTKSGYDTEFGLDAMCWRSSGHIEARENEEPLFQNELIANFYLNGSVVLLSECPTGNRLEACAPPEHYQSDDEPLRTGRYYNYTVSGQLNLTSLASPGRNIAVNDINNVFDGNDNNEPQEEQSNSNNHHHPVQFWSDEHGAAVAVQVLLCELGRAGFCSPFIHEEANARLRARNESLFVERGDRHGGSHVHSAFVIVPVDTATTASNGIATFNITVPMLINQPGDFFAIAAVQMFFGAPGAKVSMRYDMANALQERLISYQEPAEILEVPTGVLVFSYVAMALVASVIAFLLLQTVLHRNHQVLKLTQGCFLIVFLVAALVATLSAFTLNPRNSVYCRVSLPLVMCSLQVVFAVTVGRLWRINAVISPLLRKTLRHQDGWIHRGMRWLRRVTSAQDPEGQPKNLRHQVSNTQLALVIVLFTVPQVILQVLGAILQPAYRSNDLNEDMSKGRAECACGVQMVLHSYAFWGYIVFFLLVLTLLCMAYATRQLPSLFNETSVIFNTALTTMVLLALGGGIQAVTDGPTTTPAVKYLTEVTLVLCMTLQTSYRFMMPKLRMIWKGETVVVSKLVSDHRAQTERDDELYKSRVSKRSRLSSIWRVSGVPGNVDAENTNVRRSGAVVPNNRKRLYTRHSNSLEVKDELEEYRHEMPSGRLYNSQYQNNRYSSGTEPTDTNADLTDSERSSAIERRLAQISSGRNLSDNIIVKPDETPARRLVLKMVDLQESLAEMNRRIMSGTAVPEAEWERLRAMSNHLSTSFQQEVKFAWEQLPVVDVGDGSERDERAPLTLLKEDTSGEANRTSANSATIPEGDESSSVDSEGSDGLYSRISL